ncbi:MAG: 50S ribosomal protein L33 [Alphaproteobacteria bacterium]
MAKRNATIQVRLVSTAKKEDGKSTGFYYVKNKNPRTMTEKMKVNKYDPVVRKHVLFEEKSMPRSKK